MDFTQRFIKKFCYKYAEDCNPYWGNKKFILRVANRIGIETFDDVSKKLLGDKEFVLDGIKNHRMCLHYVSEELQNDKDVLYESIKIYYYALGYAPNDLRNDKKFMLKCTKIDGYCLQYASKELQNNKKLILIALKKIYFINHFEFKREENPFKFKKSYHPFLKKSYVGILKFY